MASHLRFKVLLAVGLSLALADAMGVVVARETFERAEIGELREGAESFVSAVSARLDERVAVWQTMLADASTRLADEPHEDVLRGLLGEGVEGVVHYDRDGHTLAVAHTGADAHEELAAARAAIAIPGGVLAQDDHLVLAVPAPRGGILAMWTSHSFQGDILAANWPLRIVNVGEGTALSDGEDAAFEGNALIIGRPSTRAALRVEAAIDTSGAVRQAGEATFAFFLASTAAYLAAGAFIAFLVAKTLQPLAQITQAAERLGRGASELGLDIETDDEMEVLAKTLSASAKALADARAKEREQSAQLRRSVVDRARLEAAFEIERRERDHRTVLESLTDCVLVVDRAGTIVVANAAARALGFAPGASALLALAEADAPALVARVAAAGATASPRIQLPMLAGRTLEAEVRQISYDESDAVLIVASDVTERIRLAAEAAERREALERSERLSSLGTLVAGVAHEINNPLTFINGNIELAIADVEELPGGEAAAARLRSALSGTARIAHITRALRVVARQRHSGSAETIDLCGVAQNVEALLSAGLPSNVVAEFELARTPVMVRGSSTELHQVLLNLAKNAIEAVGPSRGTIRVRCEAKGDEALLEVADDGPGIPAEVLERLFTPFYTTKPGGTGLGLSIAHGIVRDHGGQIEVRSSPGQGARFLVRLPLAQTPRAPAATSLSASSSTGSGPHPLR